MQILFPLTILLFFPSSYEAETSAEISITLHCFLPSISRPLIELWDLGSNLPGDEDEQLAAEMCDYKTSCTIYGVKMHPIRSAQFLLKILHKCTSDGIETEHCHYMGNTEGHLTKDLPFVVFPMENGSVVWSDVESNNQSITVLNICEVARMEAKKDCGLFCLG